MAKEEEHKVRNGILIAVSSSLILTAIYLLGGWALPKMRDLLASCWKRVTTNLPVPVWLLGVLALIALHPIARSMLELFGLRRKTPSWKDYKEDRFYGMLWRWSYWGREVIDLWCFCPVCDTVLVYGEDRHVGTTTFSCETCNRLTGQEAGDKDYVFAKVKRQIDRKIRTGEWSKALESTQRANPTQRTQE